MYSIVQDGLSERNIFTLERSKEDLGVRIVLVQGTRSVKQEFLYGTYVHYLLDERRVGTTLGIVR